MFCASANISRWVGENSCAKRIHWILRPAKNLLYAAVHDRQSEMVQCSSCHAVQIRAQTERKQKLAAKSIVCSPLNLVLQPHRCSPAETVLLVGVK